MKSIASILIVDDDEAVLTTARLFLKQKFSFVQIINHPDLFDGVMQATPFDLVLLDMNYEKGASDGQKGLDLIHHILKNYPGVDILAITAYGDVELAVEALKSGARDFITKPWNNARLLRTIERLLSLQHRESQSDNQDGVIGKSAAFLDVLSTVEKVAPTDAHVLILGENGTGKGLIAKRIHDLSFRRDQPFVRIDMGALVESLFESELFGHKKGAFTDAVEDRIGKIQQAHGGTLFLDEIGNISLAQQSKLLTFLEQKTITKVGTNNVQAIDVRMISATNAELNKLVAKGQFRQDFLYRINTIEITMPPLIERKEDIRLLVKHFFAMHKKNMKRKRLN